MSALLGILGKVGASMLMSLVTEKFLKRLTYRALRYAAQQSENSVDDRLVEDVAEAWGIEDGEK